MKNITVEEAKQMVVGRKIIDMSFCEDSGKMKFVLDNGDVVYCRYFWSSEYFGAGVLTKEEELEITLCE